MGNETVPLDTPIAAAIDGSAAAQEAEITSIHHGDRILDEANCLGTHRQGFPPRIADGFCPEEDGGDFAIGRFVQMRVERAQHLDQASSVPWRKPQCSWWWPRLLVLQDAAESECTCDTQQKIVIEW